MHKIDRQKTIKIDEYEIELSTGSEGPDFDPYSFQEIEITSSDVKLTCHSGLGLWIKTADKETTYREYDEMIVDLVTILGFDPWAKIEEYQDRPKECKCKSGEQELEWIDGYPGEHFLMCKKCKEIVDTEFCLSEIE